MNQQIPVIGFVFLVWSSQVVPFRDLVRADFFSRIVVTVLLFVGNNLQLLPTSPEIQLDDSTRLSFGFHHPNALGMYLMMIMIEAFYLYAKGKKWPVLGLVFGGILIYLLTRSRGSFLAVISFAALVGMHDIFKSKSLKRLLIYFCIAAPFICFFGSFVISVILPSNSRAFQTLNGLLSGRPELLKLIYEYYAQKSFFGASIAELANSYYAWSINVKYLFVDNQYMYTVMIFGWFGAALEIVYAVYCALRAKIYENWFLLFWLTAMAFFGLVETKLVTLDMALPFMCLGSLAVHYKSEKVFSETDGGNLKLARN
ncbi:O-antigen ligase family protein [Lacticaseibacillus styriensis]|uniref:O-antigen ligase family protein n=1 Tax=Lacticaseibacillus styriensis TaxID=3068306 RepID=UPI003AB7B2EE